MDKSYVIISPCRNEQEYMHQTMDTVINQTLKPTKWVIVDDGSTDDTAKILREYANKHAFIEIVTIENRSHQCIKSLEIDSFYRGYNTIEIDDYTYICKLDLDLNLPKGYFETLINEMEQNPRLGTISGKPYLYNTQTKQLIPEVCGNELSAGMIKFYKVNCFKEIGGFVRQVMWDGIDSHRCRLLGWISKSDKNPVLRFIHLRPMGSSQKSIITGRVRHGCGQYSMGTRFPYMLASVVFRLNKKPYVIGSLAILWGYIKSSLVREEKFKDPKMQSLMNKLHWQSLFIGKIAAVDKINLEREDYFGTSVEKYDIPNKTNL